jgi:DNA-binding response OmpR family regulator
MRVLLVEDDEDVLSIFQMMLEDFEVIPTRDGESAVEIYKKERPDVVIMDIVLPDKSGIDATKEIISFDPEAVIIAITAFPRKNKELILQAGAVEVIEKPFRKAELIEKINKYRR